MSLIDNINFLKENFNDIYFKYKKYNEKDQAKKLQLTESVNGQLSLMVEFDSNYVSLNSRYNPKEEAEIILKEHQNVMRRYKHVLFYGVGLGYIIDVFVNQYPDKEFSIYEPIENIFDAYMNSGTLVYKNLKNICIGDSKADIDNFLSSVFENTEKGILFLFMPAYKRIFDAQYNHFKDILNLHIKDRRSTLATDYLFQKRWISNSVNNFEYTLNTPDIFTENAERFKDKTAILVSAGPSLDFELENLKYIKDNNMAFIFSVSSATNILLKNGIKPHAVTSYDPGDGNMYGVFKKIIDEDLDDFPLIFGSTICSDIIDQYKGPMVHMITTQDTISRYYLRDEQCKEFNVVMDAPSIAVLTLELFYRLGCSKIILVGQNLSYYKGQNYGSEMDKERGIEIDLNSSSIIKVEDVYGNPVPSSIAYISAKNQLETYIQSFNNIEVINTTKYGANIKGTVFKELSNVIADDLKSDSIDLDFYKFENTEYNEQFLKQQKENMDNSRKEYDTIINTLETLLNKIKILVRNNNYNQLDHMYLALNDTYQKLEGNHFFDIFVLPMNRVSSSYLYDKLKQVPATMNPLKRADTIVNEYKRFLFACKKQVKEDINDMYEKLNETIENNTSELKAGYKIFSADFIIEPQKV